MRVTHAAIALALSLSLRPLSAQEAKLLFRVPFDGRVDATVAAGDPKGTFAKGGEGDHQMPEFVPGILGQGLEIGRYGYEVGYEPQGNINPDRGTLLF